MKTGNEIKKELAKALNVKSSNFSCSTKNGSYSITVKTFAISGKQVERYMNQYKNVRRCEASGDILCGGNTFVFVDYDYRLQLTEEELADVVSLMNKVDLHGSDFLAKHSIISEMITELERFSHLEKRDAAKIVSLAERQSEEFRAFIR